MSQWQIKPIDRAVSIARINMWQAVLVAAISALAGVVTTVVVKDSSTAQKLSQTQPSTVSGISERSNLHYAYRWVYPDKSVSNDLCVSTAIRVLESIGVRDLSTSQPGTTVFGHQGSSGIMVACRTDHGVALIGIMGPESTLITDANDLKTRMDVALKAP